MAEYFPCRFRLEGVDHYVIWYSDDQDGLVRDSDRLVTSSSLTELQVYAQSRGLLSAADVVNYDWDFIARWCDDPATTGLEAGRLLNAWNMVLDSMPRGEEPRLFSHANACADALYDKLFRANNLPAMALEGAASHAVWTNAEMVQLTQLLRLGVAEIRHQLNGSQDASSVR